MKWRADITAKELDALYRLGGVWANHLGYWRVVPPPGVVIQRELTLANPEKILDYRARVAAMTDIKICFFYVLEPKRRTYATPDKSWCGENKFSETAAGVTLRGLISVASAALPLCDTCLERVARSKAVRWW